MEELENLITELENELTQKNEIIEKLFTEAKATEAKFLELHNTYLEIGRASCRERVSSPV